jgi:CubicO group peptidase (beta-lactamase class C family)
VELGVLAKPETIFQSGSVGKQFVSAAIMMLVEEGKLSLDDSSTKYFSDAPAAWKPILIKNLLSHTSGLTEYESEERTGPTWRLHEVTANLPDRPRRARWRLSGSREHCSERRN